MKSKVSVKKEDKIKRDLTFKMLEIGDFFILRSQNVSFVQKALFKKVTESQYVSMDMNGVHPMTDIEYEELYLVNVDITYTLA